MKNVEDIYPPSPLQESLLYHVLSAPGSSVGVEQKISTLRGELDLPAFERTWQTVIDRHPILRTAFVVEGVEKPLQVVRRKAVLPVRFEDLQGQPRKKERIQQFMREDRERGFDLKQAPLMRVALFRTADTIYQFVWSYHHLVLDAWCRNLLLREVFTLYDAYRRGRELELPRSRPFRDYIVWLSRQEPAEARAFWQHELGGVRAPTRLGLGRERRDGRRADRQGERQVVLGEDVAAALTAFGRRHRVTLNTVVQGAWAILLSRYSGATDVVYGTTVSGRPADLPGVESILGMFINNLPVRLRVPPDAPLASWLGTVQAHLAELRRFEHSAPAQIQEASGFDGGQRLFESLIVFQNYPSELPTEEKTDSEGSEAPDASGRGLRVSSYAGKLETSYPVTLAASPGRKLALRLCFQRHRLEEVAAIRMILHLRTLLEGFADAAETPLADLPMLTAPERHQLLVELPAGEAFRGLPETVDPGWERLLRSPATGAGPVGLVLEPRAETVAALQGIVHAGRACLPLDPQAVESASGRLAEAGVDALIGWPEDLPLDGFAGVRLDWDAARAADAPETSRGPGSEEPVPPRTPLELRLVQLWEELFGFGPIGIHESFFQLGGHSLLAVRLLAELRSRFGRDLPLSTLLHGSTIEKLARVLNERREAGPRTPLVEIQGGGQTTPLFCVHPGGGNVLCYVDLAYHLGPDRPILAFQSLGLGEGEHPLESVERMAAVYLGELRERQPSGPYYLLGWSFGGLVAYEMARRLAEAGEPVPLLALLDTGILGRDSWQDDADLLTRFLAEGLALDAGELRESGDLDAQIRFALARAEEKGLLPEGFDQARARRLFEVRRSNKEAARRYEPGPYPGRVALLLSDERHREMVEERGLDSTLGWGDLARGGVEVITVPGRHQDMVLRPHVAVLAARLKPFLEVA